MYILLAGSVTIYIQYMSGKAVGGVDESKASSSNMHLKSSEAIRQQLGTFVITLGICRPCYVIVLHI